MCDGRLGGDSALDQQARLMHGIELIGIDRARAGDADLQRVDLPADDARARALADRHDADRRQRLDRAAHGLTANRQERGEFSLARQFFADLKDARCDERRKLVANPLAHGAPADLRPQERTCAKDACRRRPQTRASARSNCWSGHQTSMTLTVKPTTLTSGAGY